jgi:hypothetical protein
MSEHDESPGVVVAVDGDWLQVVIAKADAADPCFRANWKSRFVRHTSSGDSVYRLRKGEVRQAGE